MLVAVYFALRATNLAAPAEMAWTAVAAVVSVASPVAGLTMLAAIGPFTEAQAADGRISAVPFLLAAIGLATLLRIFVARGWPRPGRGVLLAMVLFVGTALGVGVSWLSFGQTRGVEAAQLWVPGIGGALTVLIASAWLARRGEVRPLLVGVGAIVAGALVSVGNWILGGGLQGTIFGWMLRDTTNAGRLGGLIPAPNAAAALFLVGIAVCLSVVLLDDRRAARIAAAVAALGPLAALGLTFSRSGLIGLAVVVVIAGVGWRRWRRLGVAVTLLALVAGVVLADLVAVARDIPFAADAARVDAWTASVRMWLANPIVGGGFRSFEWLHGVYGSISLDAPHNEWLRLFAEEGTFIGVAGLAFAVLAPLSMLGHREYVAVGAGAAAAGLFIMACFNNPFLYAQVNVPAFLIIGTGLGFAQRTAAAPLDGAQRTPISSLERSTRSA